MCSGPNRTQLRTHVGYNKPLLIPEIQSSISTMGTLMFSSRCAHGTITVRSRYAHGTITVGSRYADGTISQITVCSRYAHGPLTVRENILGLYLDTSVHTNIVTSRCAQQNAQLNHKHFDYRNIIMELDNNTEVRELPEDGTLVPKHVAVGT